MGRGDNRRSRKVRQRRAWRRKKLRLRKKLEGAKGTTKKPTGKK